MRYRLRAGWLDVHITHTCNERCAGCCHYCEYGLPKFFITPAEFRSWLAPWAPRIEPSTLVILGGEPTLHPQLCELLEIAAEYFPSGYPDPIGGPCPLCLLTNGTGLHRHPDLFQALIKHNIRLSISLHKPEAERTDQHRANLAAARLWQQQGVDLSITDYSDPVNKFRWRLTYTEYNGRPVPSNQGNPRLSWEKCSNKFCPQLFQGKLWKCPLLAYLPMLVERLGLQGYEPYLAYRPLAPDCSDEELQRFVSREDEEVCNLCPTQPVFLDRVEQRAMHSG